ncbi:MAG: transglycosylase domain-containing protein [Candidatus Fimenecus sp.]
MRKKAPVRNSKNHKKINKTLLAVLAVLFTGFLTCVIIGSYVLFDVISTVNGDRLVDLEFYKQNQDQTTIIYANDAENNPVELARLHGAQNRVWVSKDNMSEWMGKAFVSLEDKRFEKHNGVDWVRTILGVAKSKFKQGGSTITQQLIKNLTGENGRTINRKYNEILSAMNLEKYYDKEVILEAYLNTVYLSHGCYGVKTAAEIYFGKDVSELNLAECASLAAITQSPGEYDPLWNPENNKIRQEYCLRSMLEQKVITQEQYDEAVAYELIFTNSEKYVEKEDNSDKDTAVDNEIQSYYVDYVISSVIKDLKAAGYSHYEATKMIYSGGLRIYSAVDTKVQDILEDVYVHRTNFPSERVSSVKDQAQSAMTIMDYSGRVVAIVGGAGEKTENRSNNRAVSAARQPGSSIKPLSVYAPGIEENYITWSSKIKNYGITWKGKIWPTNYGGDPGSPNSFLTVQYALAISYNTVPAQLLMMMGFKTSYSYLTEKFHISTLNADIDSQAPSALATGGTNGGITTLEMAAAYASFGNGGKYYKPYCYYKVTDSTGENVILQNNPEGEQIISPESAYVMNELLRTVVTSSYGTGRNYGVKGFTTYMKTGTTSDNYDKWCCAGTPYYVAAVWFGYDYNKEIKASGNPAGLIYKTVMDRVHKGLAVKSFEQYTDQVVQRTYCTSSGLLAGNGCYSKATGWYKLSNLPGVCANCNGAPPASENEGTTSVSNPETPTESTTAAPVETTSAPAPEPPATPEAPAA